MIKIQIIDKKLNQVGWGGQFETQAEADAWVSDCIANNLWGKGDRWLRADENNQVPHEDINAAIDSRQVQNEAGDIFFEYHFGPEYEIAITDITEQVTKERLRQEGLVAQSKGAEIIAAVWSINESKNISASDLLNLMNDSELQTIERLLWVGALQTAKTLVANYSNPIFTSDDKAAILDLFP